MKSFEQIEKTIATRVRDHWAATLIALAFPPAGAQDASHDASHDFGQGAVPAGGSTGGVRPDESGGPIEDASAGKWPYAVPFGSLSSTDLAESLGTYVRWLQQWRAWADERGVSLREVNRRVGGAPQFAITHVLLPDIDTAAKIAGKEWVETLTIGRARLAAMLPRFTETLQGPEGVKILQSVTALKEVDFETLLQVVDWFASTPFKDRAGLTPRQLPIPGVHAKWMNTHQGLVKQLTGFADLHLAPAHPARVHFTYLDPTYRAMGGRRYDLHTVDDTAQLPYEPGAVVISENKDTAVGFPPVAGGIAVEGAGAGGSVIAAVPWIRAAPLVVYWGDMDQAGLEILNEFRSRGLAAASMFMDLETYQAYQRFGTSLDKKGRAIKRGPVLDTPHLTPAERALYEYLGSGDAPYLRVEQERVPLEVAADRLADLRTRPPAD